MRTRPPRPCRLLALAGCLLLACLSPGPAHANPVTPKLTVSADDKQTSSPQTTVRHDFGWRSVLDMTPITHTFTVRSLVSRPLTVDRLQGSCRCTTAVVEGTSNDGPFTLPPGGRARIQVIISPGDALPGPFEKEVYVFAGGDTSPTAILQMAGTLTSPVTFSPSSLDFGQITAKTAPQTITVTVDTRLLATGQTPRLSSDSRDLTLTAVPSTGVKSLPGTVSQTYRVMVVPHPRQKSLRASLHLVPANAATPPFGFDTWGTASVTGEVASGR